MDHERCEMTKEISEDPMTIPRSVSEGWKPQLMGDLPAAFCCKLFKWSSNMYLVFVGVETSWPDKIESNK